MNKWLFSIGVFPYVMIAATVLFVEPSWPRLILRRAIPSVPETWSGSRLPRRGWVSGIVALYLAIQILLPLRHWLYPGDVSWTEEGHRFSWHMKLRDKDGVVTFYVTDPKTNQTWMVDISDRLTTRQYSKMSTRPDMILQFAHHIKEEFHNAGIIENPVVTVDAWASLNGRRFQHFIDPTVDLGQKYYNPFKYATWIMPLQENVPPEPLTEN